MPIFRHNSDTPKKEVSFRAMKNSPIEANAVIKKEADEILYGRQLYSLLQTFGTPQISGSYALDLMVWRDLDIYLQTDHLTETDFFLLGSRICTLLQPVKMSFRNERIAKTKGLPEGLYWGIYLGNEREGAWKIDLWAVSTLECQRLLAYCDRIKQMLTPETSSLILKIKSQSWKDPEYRRSYTSTDIYRAILEESIADIKEFQQYVKARKEK
jgi:hypothetical protein